VEAREGIELVGHADWPAGRKLLAAVTKLDPAWATTWSGRYRVPAIEVHLLNNVGPAVRAQGYLDRKELLEVIEWKAGHRTLGRADRGNTDWQIEEITRAALNAPEGIQHRILTLLDYVGVRTASAILAIVFPDRETVMDIRALGALKRFTQLGEIITPLDAYCDPHLPPYIQYRDLCVSLRPMTECSLRDVDRALWAWHEAGMP
jgi:hypothetical protein